MTSYRLRPRVHWAVDRYTVKVTDARGTVRTLQYPEAAVWDLFTRGYSFAKVVAMMRHIAALDEAASEAVVRSGIEHWAECGLIERT